MMLVFYIIVINFITFVVFEIDKRAAIKHRSRIRVATLLGLAVAGGSVGALLAMHLFRHKTRKLMFTLGIPGMLVLQIAGIGVWLYFFQ